MNLNNIQVGQTYKNYKELCNVLEEPIKTGGSKKNQLKKWEECFTYNKQGNKFIIKNIKETISSNVVFFSEEEIISKYGDEEIKEYYYANKKLSGQKRQELHDILNENVEFEVTKNHRYRIIRTLDIPLPRNIKKMKDGMNKYIVPLILRDLILNDSDKLTLTIHNLANRINMVNCNYDIMDNNRIIFCNKDENIPVNFDYYNLCDYYERIDSSLKYHITRAIGLLKKASVIDYQETIYVYLLKGEVTTKNNDGSVNILESEEKVFRPATTDEINLNLLWEQMAMAEAGIDPKGNGQRECYHGKNANKFKEAYNSYKEEYNKDKKYKLQHFYRTFELYAPNKEYCSECLNYFPLNNIVENFNEYFMRNIMDNAYKRRDNYDKKLYKNPTYIEDYSNLVQITIPSTEKSLLDNEQVNKAICAKNKKRINYEKKIKYSNHESCQ